MGFQAGSQPRGVKLSVRAISSFIKRIVRPVGVARHAGVGGERRKGAVEGEGRGRVVTPTK